MLDIKVSHTYYGSKLFPDDINKIPESENVKNVKLAILFHFFSEQAGKQWTYKDAIDFPTDHENALNAGFKKLKIKWDKALSTVKEVADFDFIDDKKNYLSTLRVARLKDGNLKMNFFNVEKKGTKYSTMRHEHGPYVRDLEWQAERFKKYPISEPDSVKDKSNDDND